MRLLVLAAVLTAGPVAHAKTIEEAFPPVIRVSSDYESRVTKVSIERAEVTWLAIEVVTTWRRHGATHGVLEVDVPAGARVIGVQLETGGKTAWGMARSARAALTRYHDVIAPVMVSWKGSSGDEDHLSLDVGCLTGQPTVVTLAIDLPATRALRVEPSNLLVVDGKPMHDAAALTIAEHEPASYPHVDSNVSLLAEADVVLPSFMSGGDDLPTVSPSMIGIVDKGMIRRTVKEHMAQLRQCWMTVAQRHPDVEGNASLHFEIGADGKIGDATADGTLANDAVFDCLAAEVKTWEFPAVANAGIVVVNYPLYFRLNR